MAGRSTDHCKPTSLLASRWPELVTLCASKDSSLEKLKTLWSLYSASQLANQITKVWQKIKIKEVDSSRIYRFCFLCRNILTSYNINQLVGVGEGNQTPKSYTRDTQMSYLPVATSSPKEVSSRIHVLAKRPNCHFVAAALCRL